MDIRRIIAHQDFDGLISALLLQDHFGVEEVLFCQPWEISDGVLTVHAFDAVVDLPFPGQCALWIDHHATNSAPQGPNRHFDPAAPSCPALIAQLYGTERHELVAWANRIDTASLSRSELTNPPAALRIAMTLNDGRREYLEFLLQQLRNHDLESVAATTVVREHYARVARLQEEFLALDAVKHGNVLVVEAEHVPPFAHLLLYLSHDEPITLIVSGAGERLRVSVGLNIFNPASDVHIGNLMLQYGGGGHRGAGGCSIPAAEKEQIIHRMLAALNV